MVMYVVFEVTMGSKQVMYVVVEVTMGSKQWFVND